MYVSTFVGIIKKIYAEIADRQNPYTVKWLSFSTTTQVVFPDIDLTNRKAGDELHGVEVTRWKVVTKSFRPDGGRIVKHIGSMFEALFLGFVALATWNSVDLHYELSYGENERKRRRKRMERLRGPHKTGRAETRQDQIQKIFDVYRRALRMFDFKEERAVP